MTESERDRALLARLRDADPAATLPPVTSDRVDRLLEDAMAQDTTTETRESGTRRRGPLTWAVAAAAVAVIAGVAVVASLDSAEQDPPPPTAQPDPTVTRLTVAERPGARCMVPNAGTLGTAAYAVDGEVTAIGDGRVTLEATEWYAGDATDLVEVAAPSAAMPRLVGAPSFEVGARYLLAGSRDGDLMVCGFSAAYSADLAELYAAAFGS